MESGANPTCNRGLRFRALANPDINIDLDGEAPEEETRDDKENLMPSNETPNLEGENNKVIMLGNNSLTNLEIRSGKENIP